MTENRITRLRRIVTNRQAEEIDGYLVDLFSASAVLQVWDHIQQEADAGDTRRQQQLTKLAETPLHKVIEIALRVTE